MIIIPIAESYFHGAISVHRTETGLQPYRVPYEDIELYFTNGIGGRARDASGVRFAMVSDTTAVRLGFEPMEGSGYFSCACRESGFTATLPIQEGDVEVFLPDCRPAASGLKFICRRTGQSS